MRQIMLDQLRSLDLGTFRVSDELPFAAAGLSLYEKNPKVFYVDEPDQSETTLLLTLSGGPVLNQAVTTVNIWVTCDAKQKPSNYNDLVQAVRRLRLAPPNPVQNRLCDVSTDLVGDRIVTQFEFRFTELVTT